MDAPPRSHQHAGMDMLMWVWVGAVFVAAGVVKGVSGMGLPTLSMALLGLSMTPAAAAALLVLPSLLTNAAQCLGPHGRTLCRRLWPLWLGLAGATVFSPLPDLGAPGPAARITLGAVLAVYGLWGLLRPGLPRLHDGWLQGTAGLFVGAATGLLTAATGVFVMPLVPYLQTQGLSREAWIQALGLSFTIATLALAVRLGSAGTLAAWPEPTMTLLAVVAAFAGLGLGAAWRGRLQPLAFQRVLYAVFVLLGLIMLGRAL